MSVGLVKTLIKKALTFDFLFGTNGYIILFGAFFQWGLSPNSGGGSVSNSYVAFPISFDNACLNMHLTYYYSGADTMLNSTYHPSINEFTKSGFRWSGHSLTNQYRIAFFAIGW